MLRTNWIEKLRLKKMAKRMKTQVNNLIDLSKPKMNLIID
jgi:hypothetical protein